jgi:hypothetical protein
VLQAAATSSWVTTKKEAAKIHKNKEENSTFLTVWQEVNKV